MRVDDEQSGRGCVVQGSGCKLDLVVGQLQGWVDTHSPARQLEAPGSNQCGQVQPGSLCSLGGGLWLETAASLRPRTGVPRTVGPDFALYPVNEL